MHPLSPPAVVGESIQKKIIFSTKKSKFLKCFVYFFPEMGPSLPSGIAPLPLSSRVWVGTCSSPRGDSPPRWVENARGARGAVHVAVTYQLSWQLSNAREQMLGGGDLFTPKGIYSYPTRLCGSMGLRCPMAIRPKSPQTGAGSDSLAPYMTKLIFMCRFPRSEPHPRRLIAQTL